MDPEKVEERTTVITVEDTKVIDETKIKFAKVYRPERTKTIQTIDTTGSRRPSISAPKRPEKKRKGDKKNVDITEHLLSAEECAAKYNTHINTKKASESKGLTTQQAANVLAETGLNQLSPPKKRHPILKYIDCVLKLFNLLLILAGILDYILLAINFQENFANTYLGAILIGVALLNAFIEFYQEQKSQALLDSFLNMVPAKCMVIRDGKIQQIDAVNLVIGDVVMVRMGDKVPADLFLYQASDLKVDNSPLTGESDPQERGPNNTQKNVFEAENIIFNGTLAVSGEGYGIVVRTGDNTVLGQIAGLTAGETKEDSPLSKEIATFVKIIASIALITAAIFFGIGFPVNNNNVSLTLNFAISVFVAWVPEGLPATVTILLTISAKRMAARNVLVKDLQGVETLGAITLLATDKTGTLTRNQMTVTYIWSCLNLRNVMDKQTMSEKAIQIPGVREILNISTLNSRAKFDRVDVPVSQRQILGDATETGLVRFAGEQFGDLFDTLPDQYPKVFEIPFNSDNKWAMTIHKMKHANGDLTLYVKGAPERVLKLCDSILTESGSVPLTQEHQNAFQETYSYMAEGLMKLPPRKPVTPDSIDRYRRYLHRRQRYVQYDESGEEVRPNVFRRMYNKLHELTTATYWKEKFEKTDDEVLVDLPLLSWAYLEIGIIEAIGCLTAYFVVLWYNGITPYDAVIMQRGASSPTNYFANGPIYALDYLTATGKLLNAEAQHRALGQAQSITYWSVMVMQMFNMFACKTRFSMPIGRYMFSNKWTFAGILGGASLATLIVYCPPFNIPFGTEYHLLPLWWLIPVGFGFIIIAYACLRMKIRQRFNPINFNPEIHGLRMHPTIFTVATTESGHRMA
ncbi:Putative Podospora anserina S mat genomic DNA chromosome 5, supercontig 1 (Fragment) [Rhizopus microsporus]